MLVFGPDGKKLYGNRNFWTEALKKELGRAGIDESGWRYEYDPKIYPGVQVVLTEEAARALEDQLALDSLGKL